MTDVVEVKRKEGESGESLLRRFSKRVQQSGILVRAKRKRFHEPDRNKRAIRESALRRSVARAKHEHLRKIGKLEEDRKRTGRRRH
ncbi:MAG: 30S ribosomal protein S21 [Candidatus Kerfeldbacteria bacterium]|nr:30S ribosomal protein S21 [Candidatus Kerfeldbacteria bacterium]